VVGTSVDDTPASPEDESSPHRVAKPLPPPPPLVELPTSRAIPTVIGFGLLGADAPTLPDAPTKSASAASPPQPERPAADLAVGAGSGKGTIVGMPVRFPDAEAARETAQLRAPAATPLPMQMSDIATSEAEIPLVLGTMSRALLLLAQRRREVVIGVAAVLGLIVGFSFVRSLFPSGSHAKAGAVSTAPPAAIAVEAPPVPVADPTPEPSPSVAVATESPAVARPTLVPKPGPSRPTASTTLPAAKPPSSPPAPTASTSTVPCSPPYRLDFFGKKVPKPGCS
jgi:hypothetical protein